MCFENGIVVEIVVGVVVVVVVGVVVGAGTLWED